MFGNNEQTCEPWRDIVVRLKLGLDQKACADWCTSCFRDKQYAEALIGRQLLQ